ncbi:hypothetical protein FKP32DRAFT_642311 [Trametes sanguinea]|nr:hypothetical protein FKP32DRAFT_642311 [Trametes sanguinea]
MRLATMLSKDTRVRLWFLLCRACQAVAQDGDARSLASALQNINGMSSVLSLIPVLSGKAQNVKAIGARTFPCSLVVVGLGAGRVLSKLQIGLMLLSADLYRNLVGELSYYHHEYVNVFSPSLIHVPTGTPERHSSNTIVNHNITEDYMVEAWFRTQGQPARVELSPRNGRRVFCGALVYLGMYTLETFLCVQNAATGTALPLIVLQTVSGLCWLTAVCVLQAKRRLNQRYIYLNRKASMEYRCFQLITSGKHVQSAVLSTHLSNVRDFNLFNSEYESRALHAVGAAMVVSGVIDIFAAILVVGLSDWAYGWLALQVTLVAVKVFFSLEPMRRIPIVEAKPLVDSTSLIPQPSNHSQRGSSSPAHPSLDNTRLPILVETNPAYSFTDVCVTGNSVLHIPTSIRWRSYTPGVYIGQPYYMVEEGGEKQPIQVSPPSASRASLALALAPQGSFSIDGGASKGTPTAPTTGAALTAPPAANRNDQTHGPSSAPSPDSALFISATAPHIDSGRAPASRSSSLGTRTPTAEWVKSAGSSPLVRYLALADGRLTLSEKEPQAESNQALQREFLACLAEVVKANKVPSVEFLRAAEAMKRGIRGTMSDHWFMFGTTDLSRYLLNAERDILWSRFL